MHLCIEKIQNMHLIYSYFFNNMQKHVLTQNIRILIFFLISSINNNFKHFLKNSEYLKIYSINKTNTNMYNINIKIKMY
jgi:hypothetical protein